MDWGELSRSDWLDLIIYGALATYFASAIPRLFRGNFRAALGALAFWAAILFVSVAGYAYRFELRGVADRVMAMLIPGTAIETGPKEVTIIRRADGQFVVNGSVLGRRLPSCSIRERPPWCCGPKMPRRRTCLSAGWYYDVEVATANGRTLAAETVLPRPFDRFDHAAGRQGADRPPRRLARKPARDELLERSVELHGLQRQARDARPMNRDAAAVQAACSCSASCGRSIPSAVRTTSSPAPRLQASVARCRRQARAPGMPGKRPSRWRVMSCSRVPLRQFGLHIGQEKLDRFEPI